jgi:hypothetical protein
MTDLDFNRIKDTQIVKIKKLIKKLPDINELENLKNLIFNHSFHCDCDE